VIGLDNRITSKGQVFGGTQFVNSVADKDSINRIFDNYDISAVIHLAATKQLVATKDGEEDPYITNNVNGTAVLLECMASHGAPDLIFASSSAVYSPPSRGTLISEEFEKNPQSDYGKSKLLNEEAISEYSQVFGANCISLRFFNLAGSLEPKLFDRDGTSLIPLAINALRSKKDFKIFGENLDTADGTPIRDYVHVVDAAYAIGASLKYLEDYAHLDTGHQIYNIGSQSGTSVLNVLNMIQEHGGGELSLQFLEPRTGEIAEAVANTSLAWQKLGWKSKYSITEIIQADLINSNNV